jgi:hypothetical protein
MDLDIEMDDAAQHELLMEEPQQAEDILVRLHPRKLPKNPRPMLLPHPLLTECPSSTSNPMSQKNWAKSSRQTQTN